MSQKYFLSADNQYFIQIGLLDGNGGDVGSFGFVYHGTSPNKNYAHGNTGITASSQHIIAGQFQTERYIFERQTVHIENTAEVEKQKANITSFGDDTFYIYACGLSGGCVESDPINAAMSDEELTAALGTVFGSKCEISGTVDTKNGLYYDIDTEAKV